MADNTFGQDQQLVYRIDCDKHYTIAGAPPILVLQKESFKPPIIILEGVQTHSAKTPIIRDERKDKSQGYILQDERKPLSDIAQVNPNPTALPHLSFNRDGENPYPYHQPIPTPLNDQHMCNQNYPMNQSQDPSSFGKYPSDLSYNNNIVPTSSPWMYEGQYQHRQPYDTGNFGDSPYSALPLENDTGRTNNLYNGGYTQTEPYHWQSSSSLHQHDLWTTPQPMPTQNQPYFSPFFENSNFGGYNNTYDDRMYGREGVGMPMMPMMQMTPRPAHYDSSYNYPSSPWLAYNNNDNSTMMMPMQEDTPTYPAWGHYDYPTPPLRRNPTLPTKVRQPAFRVVSEPNRSKSVSFAPLPDHVAT